MELPFRTEEGLFLGSDDLLIPWGTPLTESTPGAPEVREDDDGWVFTWRARRAMGGLTGNVVASHHRQPSASRYPSGLPALHRFCVFAPIVESDALTTNALELVAQRRHALKRFHDTLEGSIGPASWSYPAYHSGLPAIAWEGAVDPNGDPIHFYCDVSGNLLTVSVSHWTGQYPALRADAEQLHRGWARSDARVPFVAWEPDDPRIPEHQRGWSVACARHDLRNLRRRLRDPSHELNARADFDRDGLA